MRMRLNGTFLVALTGLMIAPLMTGAEKLASAPRLDAGTEKTIRTFLATYCQECHGPEKQKAERRFDQLALAADTSDSLFDLQDIVDQLNLAEMPPEEAKRHPAVGEVREIVQQLTRLVADGHARLASTGGRTVLRRLNRREYLNTISDLLGINMTMFDPSTNFPRDQVTDHLDNIGDGLRTSGFLLAQYLEAADQAVAKAFEHTERPAEQTWHFTPPFRTFLDYVGGKVFNYRYIFLEQLVSSVTFRGGYGYLDKFVEGVPLSGWYEIRVKAQAMYRRNPYDPKLFGRDPEMPFRLGIVPGNARVGSLAIPQPIEPLLAEAVMEDDVVKWYTFKVWLDRGFTPRFTFLNGVLNMGYAHSRIIRNYGDTFPEDTRATAQGGDNHVLVLRHGQSPQIRIHEVGIRGPLLDEWPTAGARAVLGQAPFSPGRTREIVERFARRAFRRPLREGEGDRLMAVVDRRRAEGATAFEAMQEGLKAVLCSPSFIYLAEHESDPDSRALSPHALAARLSYFLWATLPDEDLRRAADSGELLETEVLRAQARRMLASPRSDAFIAGFLDAWLNFRSLGDMPPATAEFGHVYADNLLPAMKRETQLFTRDLIERNESVVRYLDSDYTFANRPLARLYGMSDAVDGATGHEFRRIKLTTPQRGGLLGQASVLTVSANGIETSPVLRGVWLLENLFGDRPPPPPDDTPVIDPDVRGAVSMRDLLDKHRNTPACFDCHRKIDPLGFALENFDPVGAWRTTYAKGVPIDPAGELPSGHRFEDVAGLRRALVERKEQFIRALTERLLAYASGRRIERLDRPVVDAILAATADDGYRFRDLLEQVVLSPVFLSK